MLNPLRARTRPRPEPGQITFSVPAHGEDRPYLFPILRRRRIPWVLTALDAMAAVWMATAGGWLDRYLTVVTLGGQHQVVFGLAVAGFVLLAGLAVVTGGFIAVRPASEALLAVAAVVSTIAIAGVLALLGVLAVALTISALGRALIR